MAPTSVDQNIISTFLRAAAERPDAIALTQDGRSLSYRQLADGVVRAAQHFGARGISKGDAVLVFVPKFWSGQMYLPKIVVVIPIKRTGDFL